MNFDLTASDDEILLTFRDLITITGWEPWAARLRSFHQQANENPLMREFIAERYSLELQMDRLHRRIQQGLSLRLPVLASEIALISFLTMVSRTYARLSDGGKKRIAGMLRGSLKNDDGLATLQHEMTVLAHLMHQGFDVELSDIENGGGCDFVARNGDLHIEVECKNFSADVGRKIHRKPMYQLGGKLLPLMLDAQKRQTGFQLVSIALPNRLETSDEQTKKILSAVTAAINRQKGPVPLLGTGEVQYQVSDTLEDPFVSMSGDNLDREAIRRYLDDKFGISAAHAMVYGNRRSIVVINVESRQSDKVMTGLMAQLKSAVKGQLSGSRPAMLCVRFADITEEELVKVADHDEAGGVSALQRATSYLLNRQDWKPVHTIAYFAPGRVERGERNAQERGLAYSFVNTAHEMAEDPRLLKIFG